MIRILVIKLGALGDFVQAFGAFATVRAAYPDASITLLTTAPFVVFAQASPWFDDVLTDTRPSLRHPRALLSLARELRSFDHVFDFQTSGRSGRYFRMSGRLCGSRTWSGIARHCSHPHTNPSRDDMHTLARLDDQLRSAGLIPLPRSVPGWLTDKIFPINGRYGVLVPGAALHRPRKRWPVSRFAALAHTMASHNMTPVIVGGTDDRQLGAEIRNVCPEALDLTGNTDLRELASILHHAELVIGNDTGPMHLASAMDTPCVTLFSDDSDPRLTAPLTITPSRTQTLVVSDLALLPVERVAGFLPV